MRPGTTVLALVVLASCGAKQSFDECSAVPEADTQAYMRCLRGVGADPYESPQAPTPRRAEAGPGVRESLGNAGEVVGAIAVAPFKIAAGILGFTYEVAEAYAIARYSSPASISTASHDEAAVCVRYETQYGWSNRYAVVGRMMSGASLNAATGRIAEYSAYAFYVVIFWGDDQASILRLPAWTGGSVPLPATTVTDQRGRRWEIRLGHVGCF